MISGARPVTRARDAEGARVRAFMRRIEDLGAPEAVPFEWGTALRHPDFPRVWDLNFLRVDRPSPGLSAEALGAAAERLQGGRGLAHRKVVVTDAGLGRSLAPGFERLGWLVECHVVMVHRRSGDRAVDTSMVVEVDAEAVRATTESFFRTTYPGGADDETVRELLDRARVTERAVQVRHFGVMVEGSAVSICDLYLADGVAQIEDVATLEPFRGRGLARSVVTRALHASRDAGAEVTFLVADRDDWPREMYRKLGFDEADLVYNFMKLPPAHQAPR